MRTKARKIFADIALYLGMFLVTCTAISLLHNTSRWFIQIFHFPRLQAFIGLVACAALFLALGKRKKRLLVTGAMIVALTINAWHLFPYTTIAGQKINGVTSKEIKGDGVISILEANVLMKNRNADNLLSIVQQKSPKLFLAMEVNGWWIESLRSLENQYPYTMYFPADNTYGMALYSKYPLHDQQTMFFNHDSVPAFLATVTLPNRSQFQLLTVHPVAPKASKHPDNVSEEEVGLIKAARAIAKTNLPAIVCGDFNDVAWSPNVHKFEKISGLNDIRGGRGLYNTFNAKNIFMRWPLDYIYTSQHFKVITIERLPAFGSDHFPLYAELFLSGN